MNKITIVSVVASLAIILACQAPTDNDYSSLSGLTGGGDDKLKKGEPITGYKLTRRTSMRPNHNNQCQAKYDDDKVDHISGYPVAGIDNERFGTTQSATISPACGKIVALSVLEGEKEKLLGEFIIADRIWETGHSKEKQIDISHLIGINQNYKNVTLKVVGKVAYEFVGADWDPQELATDGWNCQGIENCRDSAAQGNNKIEHKNTPPQEKLGGQNVQTQASVCVDVQPDSDSCAEKHKWGQCEADWMKENNWCRKTCGVCQ